MEYREFAIHVFKLLEERGPQTTGKIIRSVDGDVPAHYFQLLMHSGLDGVKLSYYPVSSTAGGTSLKLWYLPWQDEEAARIRDYHPRTPSTKEGFYDGLKIIMRRILMDSSRPLATREIVELVVEKAARRFSRRVNVMIAVKALRSLEGEGVVCRLEGFRGMHWYLADRKDMVERFVDMHPHVGVSRAGFCRGLRIIIGRILRDSDGALSVDEILGFIYREAAPRFKRGADEDAVLEALHALEGDGLVVSVDVGGVKKWRCKG